MKTDNTIFKAYDIRGVVPASLNPDVALALGRSFGTQAMACGQTQVTRRNSVTKEACELRVRHRFGRQRVDG